MSTPFASAAASIPVTVVTHRDALAAVDPTATRLTLERPLHDHDAGSECVACAARGDIRALLFDLLQNARAERRTLSAVIVDATGLIDAQPVIDRLARGVVPAFGLRDHTVARSFHLDQVI